MADANRWRIPLVFILASSGALASCTSILGIQDLARETSDASLASGSGGGTAGATSMSSSGVAGATSAGMGGASTSGGGSTGASGAAGDAIGSAGSAKDASVDNTGSAGTGGQPPPDAGPGDAKVEGGDVGPLTITVTGTVRNVLRRPYPGVPVTIENKVTSNYSQGTIRA